MKATQSQPEGRAYGSLASRSTTVTATAAAAALRVRVRVGGVTVMTYTSPRITAVTNWRQLGRGRARAAARSRAADSEVRLPGCTGSWNSGGGGRSHRQ